ncbi:MAG: limonene-1,2-epoxide hydrolase family protein [Candidatus Binatia bacterium]
MSAENEKVVRDFCAAWRRKNIDELLGFLAPDAVYHNMPMEPLHGIDAIRQTLDTFMGPAEEIEFEMLGLASAGDLVFTERTDRFTMMGKTVVLPVAGVFEVRGGKIVAWRDYFDMQTWLKQTGAA